jgi:hypothetical protein
MFARALAFASFTSLAACSSGGAPEPAVTPPSDGHVDPNLGDVDPGGPIAATLDDVSILFPLPVNEADRANLLSASSSGARGALLPEEAYTKAGSIGGSDIPQTQTADGVQTGVPFARYPDLRVVAARLDPCFADMHPDPHGTGCEPQVRLIFQEVLTPEDTGPQVFDSGLHAIYSLPRNELLTLARKLVALRQAAGDGGDAGDSGGPLGVSPLLAQQGLGGSFSLGVQQLLLQYVGQGNLVRIATFGIDNGVLAWGFHAVDVGPALAMTTVQIPNLPDGSAGAQGVSAQAFADPAFLSWQMTPAPSGADDLSALGGFNAPAGASTDDAFAALLRIEDPTQRTFNTTDCISCHLATPIAKLVALPLGDDDTQSPQRFQPAGGVVTAADMAPTFGLPNQRLDLHAFSYVGQQAAINQRVVNESALVVGYLRALPSAGQ